MQPSTVGGRALRWVNAVAGQNTKISQLLSAKPGETAAAVERMQKEVFLLKGRVAGLEEPDRSALSCSDTPAPPARQGRGS